jgi:glutaredoxin-like protein
MQQTSIPDQEKATLKRTFRKDLKGEVALRLFTQMPSPIAIPGRECKYCPQTQQMMEELASLSPKLNLETVDFYAEPDLAEEYGITRIPALVIGSKTGSRVRFFGIPAGYELGMIIEDIKTISNGTTPLSMDTRKRLRAINSPVHIQVFVTPDSVYCPSMARLSHALAMANEHITADVIELQEFPALGNKYGIRSVPLTVINDYTQAVGVVLEPELVAKVVEAGVRKVEKPDEKSP